MGSASSVAPFWDLERLIEAGYDLCDALAIIARIRDERRMAASANPDNGRKLEDERSEPDPEVPRLTA